MRKDFATRQTSRFPRCCQHSSRRGDVLDGLVLMMASFLLVAFILGHLLLACYPQTASAADSGSATANSLASTDGEEPDGGLSEDGAGTSTEGGDLASDADPADDPSATSADALASKDAEIQKQIDRASELESEVESLKTTNEQLLAENSSMKNAPVSLPSSTDEAEVSKLRDDLLSANEQLTAAEKQAMTANQQLQKSETSFQELQTRLRDVQTALTQTESDLAIAKADQKTASDIDASSPFANMTDQNKNDAANEALAEEVKQAEAKVSELQLKVASLEENLKSTTDKVTAREQELQSAQFAADKLKLAAQQLKTRNDELANQLKNAANATKAPAAKLPKEVYRDFVSSKGSISKMAFIRWEGNDEIIVRSFTDKRLYRLPLERFSEADKKYLLDRK